MQKNAKKQPVKKNLGGRPALPPGKRRDRRLDDVRFSADELAEIKRRAAMSGATWSQWVRELLGLVEG